MSGWVKLARAADKHPILKHPIRFSVFFRLVMKAAYRQTVVFYRGRRITLERGQVCISIRDLAEDVGASKGGIERALTRLKTETMIETEAGTGLLVISIVNYEIYQGDSEDAADEAGTVGETPNETVGGQSEDSLRTMNKKERTQEKNTPPKVPLSYPDMFDNFWTAYPAKIGKGQARRAWNGALKKTDPASIIAGLRTAIRRGQFDRDPKYIPNPSTWLNGERWADQPALPITAPRAEPWQTL